MPVKLDVIDYSGGAGTEGKFIHLTDGVSECVVLSTRELHPYHANIAERFLLSLTGAKGRYNAKKDHYDTSGTGWEILGGGFWKRDLRSGEIKLGGSSQAYGAFDSSLARRLEESGAFGGSKVVVA